MNRLLTLLIIFTSALFFIDVCFFLKSNVWPSNGMIWLEHTVALYDITISWIPSMVTGYDTTIFRLRYKFTGYDTTTFRLRYQVSEYETTACKLRSMATGYDRSALEYDTILFWLRYKVTEYDITVLRLQYNITKYDITAYRVMHLTIRSHNILSSIPLHTEFSRTLIAFVTPGKNGKFSSAAFPLTSWYVTFHMLILDTIKRPRI